MVRQCVAVYICHILVQISAMRHVFVICCMNKHFYLVKSKFKKSNDSEEMHKMCPHASITSMLSYPVMVTMNPYVLLKVPDLPFTFSKISEFSNLLPLQYLWSCIIMVANKSNFLGGFKCRVSLPYLVNFHIGDCNFKFCYKSELIIPNFNDSTLPICL